MKTVVFEKLSADQLKLLAVLSKVPYLKNERITSDFIVADTAGNLKVLTTFAPVEINRSIEGVIVEINEAYSDLLHLEFLSLESDERFRIAIELSKDLFVAGRVISALQLLRDSGDLRVFTDAMNENVIEIHSSKEAESLLQLTNCMLSEDFIDKFAAQSFRTVSYVWRGQFLKSLETLKELEQLCISSNTDIEKFPSVTLLRGITLLSMGKYIEGYRLIEKFIDELASSQMIQNNAVIVGCKELSAASIFTLDPTWAEKAMSTANKFRPEISSEFFKYYILQITAAYHFVLGNLKEAYQSATTAIEIAEEFGYRDFQGPIEALYVKASCDEEFLNHCEAVKSWEEIVKVAEEANLSGWLVMAKLRAARARSFNDHNVDLDCVISEARALSAKLPYTNDLEIIADTEELFITYKKRNYSRTESLLTRIPQSPRTNEIRNALEIHKGKYPKFELPKNPSIREELSHLLIQANHPEISELELRTTVERILKISEKYGFVRLLCMQSEAVTSMIVRIASNGENSHTEKLALKISDIKNNRALLSDEARTNLTSREKEVLALLATGFDRDEICNQLALSLNTLKTHQKNLYKKLEAKNREGAVNTAKSLGLIPR